MKEYTASIGTDGRLFIPAELRRMLHISGGERVTITMQDEGFTVITREQKIKKAQKLVKKYTKNKDLLAELKKMRNKDAEHE